MSPPRRAVALPPEIELLRPWQWSKNAAVFAGLVFAHRLGDPGSVRRSLLTFGAFCLASGAVYAVNDMVDRSRDALHPDKCRRPLPSGRLEVRQAAAVAVAAAGGALGLGVAVGERLLLALAAFAVLQAVYNLVARRVAILDVVVLALGFVLRVAAGAWVLEVEVSPWLPVCTLNLALFLALAKRRSELARMGDAAAEHRGSLSGYTLALLDQFLAVAAAATLVTYALYTLAEQTVRKHGSHGLVWTLPFVVFGVFRYLRLVHRGDGGEEPDRLLWFDRPLLVSVAAWTAAVAAILRLGRG